MKAEVPAPVSTMRSSGSFNSGVEESVQCRASGGDQAVDLAPRPAAAGGSRAASSLRRPRRSAAALMPKAASGITSRGLLRARVRIVTSTVRTPASSSSLRVVGELPSRTAAYWRGRYWLSSVSGMPRLRRSATSARRRRAPRAHSSSSGCGRSGCTADRSPASPGRCSRPPVARVACAWLRARLAAANRCGRRPSSGSMSASAHSVSRSAKVTRGPDLQNREVIAHQRCQRAARLVVGGVRLVHERGFAARCARTARAPSPGA